MPIVLMGSCLKFWYCRTVLAPVAYCGALTTMDSPSWLMEPSLSLSVLSKPLCGDVCVFVCVCTLLLCTNCTVLFVCVRVCIMYNLYGTCTIIIKESD